MQRALVRTIAMWLAIAAVNSLWAFDVRATIKRVDPEQGVMVFNAAGMDRTAKVALDAKFLDASGKELENGLKSDQLNAGVEATLSVERDGNRPLVKAVRLGKATVASAAEPLPKLDTSALVALTDMGPQDEYHGFKGGLYPDVTNVRPASHEQAGLELARQVRPLDSAGRPSADGKIVLLAIGFSNTVQCFEGFMQVAKQDGQINSHVMLVNGAQGGRSAFMIKDPNDGSIGQAYWKTWVIEHLQAANVTPAQVQVIWLKETEAAIGPGQLQALGANDYEPATRQEFPQSARTLQTDLRKIVRVLPGQFPNLKLCYVSSRSYGGWALREGNREPFSYETGYSVKWLIDEQIRGDAALNFDPRKGDVQAPWLSWGPYWWANGDRPRKDGFAFRYDDFRENDRMHHSPDGQRKLGLQLLQFFKNDATAKTWFLK